MTERRRPFLVQKADTLVATLSTNPPDRFRGSRSPIEDFRSQVVEGAIDPSLTFDMLASLVDQVITTVDSVQSKQGRENHFGYMYLFEGITVEERGFPLARRFEYKRNILRRYGFQPEVTYGLYGLDDEGISFGIEATRYSRWGSSEPVDVFKVTESQHKVLDTELTVPQIIFPKNTHFVSVGDSGLSPSYQQDIIDKFSF